MFTMSHIIMQAMLNYLDYFRFQGLVKVTRNENVLQVEAEVVGVCKQLNTVGSLYKDIIVDILTDLSISSVRKSNKMFNSILQNAKFGSYLLLNRITEYFTTLDIIKAIYAQATNYYNKMNHSNKVIISNKGGGAGGGGRKSAHTFNLCWNCKEEDDNLHIYKKPKDQNRITKNKRQYLYSKEETGGTKGGYRGDKNQGTPRNEDTSPEYQHKK